MPEQLLMMGTTLMPASSCKELIWICGRFQVQVPIGAKKNVGFIIVGHKSYMYWVGWFYQPILMNLSDIDVINNILLDYSYLRLLSFSFLSSLVLQKFIIASYLVAYGIHYLLFLLDLNKPELFCLCIHTSFESQASWILHAHYWCT